MAQKGRPPKSRTGIEPIAPALWDRIRRNVSQGLLQPIHGCEVARLAHHGEITATEAAAAFRVAEIYGRFDQCMGRTRSARSPSYQMGYSGTAPESQQAADEREAKADRRETSAAKQWDALRTHFNKMGATSAELRRLEELCVEDISIGPIDLIDIRKILQRLAQDFRIVAAPKNSELKRQARRVTQTVIESTKPAAAAPPQRSAVDRESFLDVVRKSFPELTEVQLESMFSSYCAQRSINTARRDRDAFRDEKKHAAPKNHKP